VVEFFSPCATGADPRPKSIDPQNGPLARLFRSRDDFNREIEALAGEASAA
jgi:hypothetical protein